MPVLQVSASFQCARCVSTGSQARLTGERDQGLVCHNVQAASNGFIFPEVPEKGYITQDSASKGKLCLSKELTPSASLLQWQQDRNVQSIQRMRRIERTLLIKTEKFRNSERLSSCTGLEFLHGLRLSFSDWLGEAEAETMASLEGVARCGIHYRRECLAQFSLPQDRTKVCAILLQKLRCCEEQWRRAFDKGRDLDTLSVPSLTKGVSCDHSTAPYQVPS